MSRLISYHPQTKHQSLQWITYHSLQHQNRRGRSKARSWAYSFYFLYIRSQHSTVIIFWGIWKRTFDCGMMEIGCSITVHWHCSALTLLPIFHTYQHNHCFPLPYSLDLAPYNFFLFFKVKCELKDRHSDTIEAIQCLTECSRCGDLRRRRKEL